MRAKTQCEMRERRRKIRKGMQNGEFEFEGGDGGGKGREGRGGLVDAEKLEERRKVESGTGDLVERSVKKGGREVVIPPFSPHFQKSEGRG